MLAMHYDLHPCLLTTSDIQNDVLYLQATTHYTIAELKNVVEIISMVIKQLSVSLPQYSNYM